MNLTHHFLIAMPGLEDVSFAGSVVYLCEHSERGALGLIINKPTDIKLQGLFEKVDLPLGRPDLSDAPVFLGGPVQTERGFVLHEPMQAQGEQGEESAYASTMVIPGGGLEMTTSKDVLEALATGVLAAQLDAPFDQWSESLCRTDWLRTPRQAPLRHRPTVSRPSCTTASAAGSPSASRKRARSRL